MRELKFNRKEVFLISVILFMILAWLIGNLGGAYFGLEDEKIERHMKQPDDEEAEASFNISTKLVRIVFFVFIIAGIVSIFIAPKENVKDAFLEHLPKLISIVFLFLLFEMYRYIESLGILQENLFDLNLEHPFISELLSEETSGSPLSDLGPSTVILIILISVLISVFFFIRYKKHSKQKSEREEDITSTADRAIREIHNGEDIKDVIIRNYQKMLIILEEEGIHQEISFTPRELEKKALSKLPLKEKTIDEMTTLFEEAKYSDHPLKEEKRDRAMENFRQIKAELEEEENA